MYSHVGTRSKIYTVIAVIKHAPMEVATYLQTHPWLGVEVEAPAQGSTPVLLQGPAAIDGARASGRPRAPGTPMVFIWWQCDKWTTNARMATIHHYIRLKRSFNTNCGGKSLDVLNDSRVCKCIVKLRSERARSALCPGILISLDNSNPTSFDGLISVQVCFISEYHAQQTTLRGILISVRVQMRDVDSSAAGWSVAGATVIASHGKGTWKRLVAIGQQPAAQAVSGEMARLEVRATASCSSSTQTGGWCWAAVLTLPVQNARCVHVGFSTASDIAVDQWLRLGAGVAGLKGGVSAVPTCSLFVDPASSSKLCFKGSDGVVHPLY